MSMPARRWAVVAATAVLALGALASCGRGEATKTPSEQPSASRTTAQASEASFLVDGYPADQVPLYQVKSVESSHFYVNADPNNTSIFGDTDVAYYNVVFRTSASASDLLAHYRALFDSPLKGGSETTSARGTIGDFKVSVSHYGSGDTAYLQVFLPQKRSLVDDPHFSDFPAIFEPTDALVLHESGYGLLNQSGGQTHYSRYYTVKNPTAAAFTALESQYRKLYSGKPDFSFDKGSDTMTWTDQGDEVRLNFAADQSRVFLQIFRPMS
jgi:hypothetical protein